jgi:4-hydroxy-L-threonine phosphate dehydrogenase PdxA
VEKEKVILAFGEMEIIGLELVMQHAGIHPTELKIVVIVKQAFLDRTTLCPYSTRCLNVNSKG